MQQLGHYEILRKLAVGGMAEIFLARASGTAGFEKLVVLKRVLPSIAADQEITTRFLDEARIAATLHHHNIADVFDVGEDGGEYFFAMEYIYGQDARVIRNRSHKLDRRIPPEIGLAIGIGVASALAYAHVKTASDGTPLGLVHRDISPSNVIVSYDGAIKLVDFGIARTTVRSAHTTTAGTLKGKIPYMSPEQCLTRPLDARSDLFSLGIVLYELTTGERPFQGYSDLETLEQIVAASPAPPSTMVDDPEAYPAGLDAVLLRLLRRDPDLRYESAAALLEDLERVVALNGMSCSALVVSKYMRATFADIMTGANPIVRPTSLDEALAPLLFELDEEDRHRAHSTEIEVVESEVVSEVRAERSEALRTDPAIQLGIPEDDLAIPISGPALPVVRFDPPGTRVAELLGDSPPPADDRVAALLDRVLALQAQGEIEQAIAALELAFKLEPDRPLGRHHGAVLKLFETFLGDRTRKPRLARALSSMGDGSDPLHQRAAFLLSRIDGFVSIEEILDISGMRRLEAYRHLAQLFRLGILRW